MAASIFKILESLLGFFEKYDWFKKTPATKIKNRIKEAREAAEKKKKTGRPSWD